jgi:hypothetical protein
MLAPIFWFASGLIAGMYMEDVVDWIDDVVDELAYKEPVKKKRTGGYREPLIRVKVTDTEGKPVDFSMIDYKALLNDSLKRVGLDTQLENLNKTLGQVSKAVAEAFDEAGKSGTWDFAKKFTREEKDLH